MEPGGQADLSSQLQTELFSDLQGKMRALVRNYVLGYAVEPEHVLH